MERYIYHSVYNIVEPLINMVPTWLYDQERNVTPIVFKSHVNGTVLENISCYNDLGVTVTRV